MRHLYWGIVTLFLFILKAYSQNPIINHSFTADPTARVFDGKVYLYPSHDIKSPVERLKDWFCMEDYHVYSSQNLVDWTDHGVRLDRSWGNSFTKQCPMDGFRVLFHVGSRLCVQEWKILFLFSCKT